MSHRATEVWWCCPGSQHRIQFSFGFCQRQLHIQTCYHNLQSRAACIDYVAPININQKLQKNINLKKCKFKCIFYYGYLDNCIWICIHCFLQGPYVCKILLHLTSSSFHRSVYTFKLSGSRSNILGKWNVFKLYVSKCPTDSCHPILTSF